VRDAARDTAEDVRDATSAARDAARDTAAGIGDAADEAADAAIDAESDVSGRTEMRRSSDSFDSEASLDARAGTRGARDADVDADIRVSDRRTLRGTSEESLDVAQSRARFSSTDYRSADLGLWFNRATDRGLIIADMAERAVFSRWGFRPGDRIVSVNGTRVTSERDFVDAVLVEDVDRAKVVVVRDGVEQILYVEPRILVRDVTTVHYDPLEEFGVILDDRYDNRIVVWKVIPRSPAYYAGIRAGDVIVTFEGRRVATVQDFVHAVSGIEAGTVTVGVHRANRQRMIEVDLPYAIAVAPAVVEERVETVREARRPEIRTEVTPLPVTPVVPVVPVVPRAGVRVEPPAGPPASIQVNPPVGPPVVVPQPAPPRATAPPPRRGILPRPGNRR